jgi:hypothetical protein
LLTGSAATITAGSAAAVSAVALICSAVGRFAGVILTGLPPGFTAQLGGADSVAGGAVWLTPTAADSDRTPSSRNTTFIITSEHALKTNRALSSSYLA